MVHQRQSLPLGLKARNYRAGIHARLDDLDGYAAKHWLQLLRHEHDAKAPFADLLEQLVGPNLRAGAFGQQLLNSGRNPKTWRWGFKKVLDFGIHFQKSFNLAAKRCVAGTCTIKEIASLFLGA